jgi:catechol 2,3-dioxygenase-like lactoylglutathione lyase family enzyme
MTVNRRMLILGGPALAAVGASSVAKSAATPAAMQAGKERVLGIGGLFFRSRAPADLAQWYLRHLGIDPVPSDYRHPVWQQEAGPTVFNPFPIDTSYFGSLQQAWMVNFRVRDLDAMVAQLRAEKIAVTVDAQRYPNGRFARLHDPEGNPIELWEPASPAAAR